MNIGEVRVCSHRTASQEFSCGVISVGRTLMSGKNETGHAEGERIFAYSDRSLRAESQWLA
jgi:hypothetical protein